MSRARPPGEDFVSALRADIVRVLVRSSGAPEQHVLPVAAEIIGAVAHRFGGERVYVPAPRYDQAAVVRDLVYFPHAEVCRRHGISRSTLWRIVRRQRSNAQRKRPESP